MNGGAPPALFIKLREGKPFAEVEIRYRIKSENGGTEGSKDGGAPIELGLRRTSKITYCKALKGLLGEEGTGF